MHFDHILSEHPQVDWFEAITENFMGDGGRPLRVLAELRRDYPLVLHGVSLNIGSVDPLDDEYLQRLQGLVSRFEPEWVSDHLCWTGIHGRNSHDLLPVAYSEESLAICVRKVLQVQDQLQRPLVLENPSSYLHFRSSVMPEWEFIRLLQRQTDCELLLDINNIFVSAFNHGFDASEYLQAIPRRVVRQIHLAGHQDNGNHLIDTHDRPVRADVWELYAEACRRFGAVPTMIERDDDIPPFKELERELNQARKIQNGVLLAGNSQRAGTVLAVDHSTAGC